MTKVTILGQGEVPQPEKKKIEFKYTISPEIEKKPCCFEPSSWDNVQLLKRCFHDGMDLMVAWEFKGISASTILYLGHFNDGVV